MARVVWNFAKSLYEKDNYRSKIKYQSLIHSIVAMFKYITHLNKDAEERQHKKYHTSKKNSRARTEIQQTPISQKEQLQDNVEGSVAQIRTLKGR